MNAGANVSVRGEWPGLVTLRSGWWKAVARPLNDESSEAVLRAERSTVDFVRRSADTLIGLGATGVHSPPLMRGMDRTFRAAGFAAHVELLLLERDLRRGVEPQEGVHVATATDREQAVSIDARAFMGDWRVGRLGLEDALTATPDSTMLSLDEGNGFAIVGVSTEIGYLQRIAVAPDMQGTGMGRILLRASMAWARRRGARTMMLNTQLDNERATQMYRSESFTVLPTRLTIHRYPA
jgi:ribosomal protein S18 acetylase RimI-like enzyme